MHLHLNKEHIAIEGTGEFGSYHVDIPKLLSHHHGFVALSDSHIGLLHLPKEIQELEEAVKHELTVKKENMGLLHALFQAEYCKSDAGIRELLNTYKKQEKQGFCGTLFPYQERGVEWLNFLYHHRFHGILADEMGLGKTVQILGFLSCFKFEQPLLIVTPASLLFHWKREFAKFLPHFKVEIHRDGDRHKDLLFFQNAQVVLMSYGILRQDIDFLSHVEWACVILDEAQTIKNRDSQIAKAVSLLKSQMRLSLTGTPIENRYAELESQFHFLMPGFLEKGEHPTSLKKKVNPFILRRTKHDVDIQLPAKIEQVIWVDMDPLQKQLYDQVLMRTKKESTSPIAILEAILRLRQVCCHPELIEATYCGTSPKTDQLMTDLLQVAEEGHKVLVYSQFTHMLQLLKEKAEGLGIVSVYLDGQTKDRQAVIDRFQTDPSVSIFFISLKAGGVGLNLTAADYVFIYDPWWNEAVENQAIDRAHRIGRTQTVIVRKYLLAESIEEKMWELKKSKTSRIEAFFDLELESAFTVEELWSLL